ncbi:NU5M oxidoreductase, partial [Acromyrmex heyeri]
MCYYCLVIYYHNYISYNSGMVTVLCNRIGDVGILILLILLIMLEAITKGLKFSFLYVFFITIFISGIMANFENDSALSQLWLIMIILSFGFRLIARKGIIIEIIYRWIFYFDYYMIYLFLLVKLITLGCYFIGVFLIGVVIIIKNF